MQFLMLFLVTTALALDSCSSLGKKGTSGQAKKCKGSVDDKASYEGGNGCYWDNKAAKTIRRYTKNAKTWELTGATPTMTRPETACVPLTCDLFNTRRTDCNEFAANHVKGSCKFIKSKKKSESRCVVGSIKCSDLAGRSKSICEDSGKITCYFHSPTKACLDVPGTPPCDYFGTNERLCRKVVHEHNPEMKLCKMSTEEDTSVTPTCIDFADPPENCKDLGGKVCRESKRCSWYKPNHTCYPNEDLPKIPKCDHFTKYARDDEKVGDEVVRVASRSDCKTRAEKSGLSCDYNYETDECVAVGASKASNRPCKRKARRRCLKDDRCRWNQGVYAGVGDCLEVDDLESITCSFFTKYVNDVAGKTKECRSRAAKMGFACFWNPISKICSEDKNCSDYMNGSSCRQNGCKFRRGSCQNA